MSRTDPCTPCPICQHPAGESAHLPFCSQRCQQRDLHRWLSGHYSIATEEAEQPQQDAPARE